MARMLGSRDIQCNRSARGRPERGILAVSQGRKDVPATRMLRNSLPGRGNRKCKDQLIVTVF